MTGLIAAGLGGTTTATRVIMPADAHAISALEAIYQRRATRAFTPARLDKQTVGALLRAAIQAPTAMHLEPWAFVVIQDRALLKRISDRAKTLLQAPRGADHRQLARPPSVLLDPAANIFYDAGTLIVICGKPMGPFVTADCWLAAENLMIAATALGYATCPIGLALPALGDPEVKQELGIPPDVTAIAPIIVGVPAAAPTAPSRHAPDVLRWIE